MNNVLSLIALASSLAFGSDWPRRRQEKVAGPGTGDLKPLVVHYSWCCGTSPEGELIICTKKPWGIQGIVKRCDGSEHPLSRPEAYFNALLGKQSD